MGANSSNMQAELDKLKDDVRASAACKLRVPLLRSILALTSVL